MTRVRLTFGAILAVLLATAAAAAQDAAAPADVSGASFEVASVRPSNPNTDPSNPLAQIALMLPQPGGRFTATNMPLRMLIMAAYELRQEEQLVGGPSELLSAKYDITAKAPVEFIRMKELPHMLRALLVDRFKLKARTETRELPVYDLVLARSDGRLGPDLTPSKSQCDNKSDEIAAEQSAALVSGDIASITGKPGPCAMTTDVSGGPLNVMLRGDGQDMKQLVEVLSQFTGRTVRDKTGLTGRYDFALRLDLHMMLALAQKIGANIPAGAAERIPQSDGTSLTTALNEQLGLKLESTRGEVTVVVIDSVEAPVAE